MPDLAGPVSQTYRIFVGAFPDGDLASQIQRVRLHYDAKTALITPPHVTLAGTYWRGGPPTTTNEMETIRILEDLASQLSAFDLCLGGIRIFETPRPVVYLGVEATAGLMAIRSALLTELGPDSHLVFAPHLTLAMRLGPTRSRQMQSELIDTDWNTSSFTARIAELWLMLRGPQDEAWLRVAALRLR